jgi:transcriptional regulator with XRE-family HTH domain
MYRANTSEWGLHFLNDYHSYEVHPDRARDRHPGFPVGSGAVRDMNNTPGTIRPGQHARDKMSGQYAGSVRSDNYATGMTPSPYVDDKGISADMLCQQPSDMAAPDEGVDWVNLHVCQRMKARRILRDMSQERLAAALGISYQQLQRYESGKSRLPCSMLYRAALALDVPASYFFDAILADVPGSAEQGMDKATLLAVRNIQSLPDRGMRQSLLNLIADLARAPQAGKRS